MITQSVTYLVKQIYTALLMSMQWYACILINNSARRSILATKKKSGLIQDSAAVRLLEVLLHSASHMMLLIKYNQAFINMYFLFLLSVVFRKLLTQMKVTHFPVAF